MKILLRACFASLALTAVAPAQDDFWADQVKGAERALLRGKLATAREGFEEVVASFEEDPEEDRPDAATTRRARQGLMEIGLIRGEYGDVRVEIDALSAADRRLSGYRALEARVLQATGDYARAADLWKGLAEASPVDTRAGYWHGHILRETGDAEAAREVWTAMLARHDAEPLEDPVAVAWLGRAVIELGGRANVERASRLLADSIQRAPDRPEARTSYGLLKLEVYNEAGGYPSGERDLKKVLEGGGEVEEALVGLYRLRRSNMMLDPSKTESYLRRALAINPRSVPALIERGVAFLRDRRFDVAAGELDKALDVNPYHKVVLAHRAAAALLMNEPDAEQVFRRRARATDPGFADIDRIIGDHLVALYRFEDALPYYRRALEGQPESVPALRGIAKALIYTGRGGEAEEILKRVGEMRDGYVDPWRNNAIAVEELLAEQYRTLEGDGFKIRMHRDDYEVLGAYLLPLCVQAREQLGEKYGLVPDGDVLVEVLHTWDDFSVRTIGYRGFQAAGACFGRFITLVSPADQGLRRADLVWEATVWHEFSHVLTLALSKHRVPRWLTEGFSVYEERQKNPAWERGMQRDLFDAFHNRQVVPLLQLNRLFRGPRILFGYYQGGLIVDYLAREHGFDKVVELVRGYGEDRPTAELFRDIFSMSTAEFDRRFMKHVEEELLAGLKLTPRFADASIERLRTRIAAAGKGAKSFDARIDLGWAFVQRDNTIDAATQLGAVLRDAPDHPRAQLLHAELLRLRGATDDAVAAYRRAFDAGMDDFDARIRLGRILVDRGEVDGALDQFQRAKACWPRCTDLEVAPALLVSRLLREQGRVDEAMMELKAFVRRTGRAFKPRLDLAELANEAGDTAEEIRLLEEANAIDPFMRELHVRLGDAYLVAGRREEAIREWRVGLAVRPEHDRAHIGSGGEVPGPDSEGEREARAGLCVRLAEAHHAAGRVDDALEWLGRAEKESQGGEGAERAAELRNRWK